MAACTKPYVKITGEKYPCGKCVDCQKRHISGWAFRLRYEDRKATSSIFLTLTYDEEHMPWSANGYRTLVKSDVQKFIKRLRKINKKIPYIKSNGKTGYKSPIIYYAVGEYGQGTRKRPHYHLIMFNADPDTIQDAWSLDGKPIGGIHIGQVSGASVAYTLKYIQGKIEKTNFKKDDRQKEFSLMSKGIGKGYFNNKTLKWHRADLENRMYLPIEDGKRIAMPRYYKEMFYTQDERELIADDMAIAQAIENMKLSTEELLAQTKKNLLIREEQERKKGKSTRLNPKL